MVNADSTNIRLQNVERAVDQLTDRVGDIAKFMERLVSIEERNGFMKQNHDDLKEAFKESVATLTANQQQLETKVASLHEKMIRMLTIFSIATGIVAFAAPYVVKAVLTVGVPT